jgi:hypothetical protein
MTAERIATSTAHKMQAISWPGAGKQIFWQLGVLKELSVRYDLSKVSSSSWAPVVGSVQVLTTPALQPAKSSMGAG